MSYSYKIVKESAEDPKDSVIEKSGITAEFTLRSLEAEDAAIEKRIKELKGMVQVREAIMSNVSTNHPFVLDMSEEDRYTIHMYQEAFAFCKVARQELEKYEQGLIESKEERGEIEKQVGIAIPLTAVQDAPTGEQAAPTV